MTAPRTRSRKTGSPAPAASDGNQTSLDGWLRRTYQAVLPSGMEVEFRLPSLGEMAAFGELPAELQELAVAEWSQPGVGADLAAAPFLRLRDTIPDGTDPSSDDMEQAMQLSRAVAQRIAALNLRVVAAALIRPTATPEQLAQMPYRDLEMLSILINRGTGQDAAGRYVGVVPLDQFQIVAHAHGAECDGSQTCPSCRQAGRQLAQVQP